MVETVKLSILIAAQRFSCPGCPRPLLSRLTPRRLQKPHQERPCELHGGPV